MQNFKQFEHSTHASRFVKTNIKSKLIFALLGMSIMFSISIPLSAVRSAVIGTDDRVVTNDVELLKRVGSVLYQGRVICTGFASAKNQITTAAGCVDERNIDDYTFAFIDKKEKKIQKLRVNKKTNLAFLKVDGINDFFQSEGLLDGRQPINLVSYKSGDNLLNKTDNGEVWFTPVNGLLYHTFSSDRGAAGSPILQNGKVVAVHLGTAKYTRYAEALRPDSHASIGNKENINYNVAVRYNGIKDVELEKVKITFETGRE
ncbi:MAG: trypsin-like peptidase domain-containing protein [Oligoflexia bacterium]|nr:trypsin-like peptidase domain-containing protein [Oligoflexia bacterium]